MRLWFLVCVQSQWKIGLLFIFLQEKIFKSARLAAGGPRGWPTRLGSGVSSIAGKKYESASD